jgi:hypothetical protein
MVGCNSKESINSEETLGSIKELTEFLPDEKASWTYKGTGTYYHQMTLEDIIASDQSFNYKIKAEILSDEKNSKYSDYLTEIRYILSKRGWRQELKASKLLDSKYKDMFLIKFPIEANNVWYEKVLDFENQQHVIKAEIQAIDFENNQKTITVKYAEENSDYYEVRKFNQGKGVIEFKQNIKINQENTLLGYSLESFNSNDDSLKTEIKRYLVNYNTAWQNYYNKEDLDILEFIKEGSILKSSILTFDKAEESRITFIGLSVEFVQLEDGQYKVSVEESFSVEKNNEDSIQRSTRIYTLTREDKGFKILKIE